MPTYRMHAEEDKYLYIYYGEDRNTTGFRNFWRIPNNDQMVEVPNFAPGDEPKYFIKAADINKIEDLYEVFVRIADDLEFERIFSIPKQ